MVTSQQAKTRAPKKVTAAQIKAFKALAVRIDQREGADIQAKGRDLFRRHGMARDIVRKLKERRVGLGVSLADLSERTGIAKPNLSRLENNERSSPTLETLHRYAAALGMTVRVELN